jgi:hypothetical protein
MGILESLSSLHLNMAAMAVLLYYDGNGVLCIVISPLRIQSLMFRCLGQVCIDKWGDPPIM